MRTLSVTLTTAQQAASVNPNISFIVYVGGEYYTYGTERILYLREIEEPYSQTVEAILDNSDGVLTALALKGGLTTIGLGMTTLLPGTEASTQPQFKVIAQKLDSYQGGLICRLSLAGAPNHIQEDRASEAYNLESTDTRTIKRLIQEILKQPSVPALPPYSHCASYTVIFDSEDSLIDTYCPRDSFSIARGDRRLDKVRELLNLTDCVMRFESFNEIHIFVPTTTGATYDYQYSLASGHTFYNKSKRSRLVIPNYIQVDSLESQDPAYTGYAEDADSSALYEVKEFHRLRVDSDAQCTDIAGAILARLKLDAELGQAKAPMNVGAEVYDYVLVTDARQGDTVVGNIGYIERTYTPGKYEFTFRLGRIDYGALLGTLPPSMDDKSWQVITNQLWLYFNALLNLLNQAVSKIDEMWWGLYKVMTTHGDILYRGATKPERLAPDAGGGFNFLQSQGPGLPPKWTDIEALINYMTSSLNRSIFKALSIIKPSISLTVTEGHAGGAFTASKTLTVPGPTVGTPTASALTSGAFDMAIADDGGAQTDETAAANNGTANDMTLLPATPAVNDAYYFGDADMFDWLSLYISTQGVGTWTITWEYWNGSAWAALTGVYDTSNGFREHAEQSVSFVRPADWATSTILLNDLYWIRARVSAYTSKTTAPVGQQAWVGAHE